MIHLTIRHGSSNARWTPKRRSSAASSAIWPRSRRSSDRGTSFASREPGTRRATGLPCAFTRPDPPCSEAECLMRPQQVAESLTALSRTGRTIPDQAGMSGHPVDPDLRLRTLPDWPDTCIDLRIKRPCPSRARSSGQPRIVTATSGQTNRPADMEPRARSARGR